MRSFRRILSYVFILVGVLAFSGCTEDPFDGIISNERAIMSFSLDQGQMGPAVIDRELSTVTVNVLVDEGTDLTHLAPNILPSYKATITPASGTPVNFAANNNKVTYTVTSESGQTRVWTVELVPFTETLLGTYDITGLVLYGGTGPEYGGGGVLNLTDKPWVWPEEGGPAAELDNVLTFSFTGVTEDGNTYGTITNDAGEDGQYANFLYVGNPQTDVNPFYRKIPKGEGTWERNYVNKTVTFTFADGSTATGSFAGPGTEDLGNNLSKTVADNAFIFTLNGTDDWDNIYSDYDKFVKKPRKFWIEVKKRD
ncbi:DUF5018 domain-containing protein [Pontibacter mangrovi]|uniref:DUF5018 domain-containing protein n=1 Tax=Pontibacter mangrovi TaxID=2589816 RepID=A0A501W5U6_9BACT|nr:hypothetical protein [Pontibacter mangrovi]TPE43454.1 hypothetical protein FJM65_11875 [Pontibacter mangrovi]